MLTPETVKVVLIAWAALLGLQCCGALVKWVRACHCWCLSLLVWLYRRYRAAADFSGAWWNGVKSIPPGAQPGCQQPRVSPEGQRLPDPGVEVSTLFFSPPPPSLSLSSNSRSLPEGRQLTDVTFSISVMEFVMSWRSGISVMEFVSLSCHKIQYFGDGGCQCVMSRGSQITVAVGEYSWRGPLNPAGQSLPVTSQETGCYVTGNRLLRHRKQAVLQQFAEGKISHRKQPRTAETRLWKVWDARETTLAAWKERKKIVGV